MKKIIVTLLMMAPVLSFAAGGGMENKKADVDLANQASLQRGAKLFVNYCMSCHGAAMSRYNRVASDLGLSKEQVEQNLMFIADFSKLEKGEPTKIGSLMKVALDSKDAKQMFGTKVPDLSLVARSRGADWLYTYLTTFYIDEKRPYGVNNSRFPDVGMPNVLWELEGLKKPVYKTETGHDGKEHKVLAGYEQVTQGTRTPAEFDSDVRDLVNFMVYLGEPAKMVRYNIGIWVILFLLILLPVAYGLKKEFWKDIH